MQSLILIEPVIQLWNPGQDYARTSAARRDIWPSREDATKQFGSNPFYKSLDPRALRKWIEYGLRELPTETYPDHAQSGRSPVTLTTTKAQEVFTYLRPAYQDDKWPEEDSTPKREIHPDDIDGKPFYRPEPIQLFRRLSELKPSVMYIFGDKSELSAPKDRSLKMELTGTGPGGSGGVAKGRVQQTVLPTGHMVPIALVAQTATVCAQCIDEELTRWQTQMETYRRKWESSSRHERITIDDRWKELLRRKRRVDSKSKI
jgi:hypothetical protein